MSEPAPEFLACWNGRLVPEREAAVPVTDAGFTLGVTVAEQLRTFGGAIFQLEGHLARLYRGLELIGVDPGFTPVELAEQATALVAHNHALIENGDDLGLSIFVTPGPNRAFSVSSGGPIVGLHTYPLAFRLWAEKYERGVRLITAGRQTPPECWPSELKCRSRMHYFLAGRAADVQEPGATALLCHADGYVSETPTANVVIYRAQEGLVTPPTGHALPGVSLHILAELARDLDLPFAERDLRPDEVGAADEAFLTSTPYSLLPAVAMNGRPIGAGAPGATYRRLLDYWNRRVGLDMAEQARRFASR